MLSVTYSYTHNYVATIGRGLIVHFVMCICVYMYVFYYMLMRAPLTHKKQPY